MSDTPRTDAAIADYQAGLWRGEPASITARMVPADFAKGIERELHATNEALAACQAQAAGRIQDLEDAIRNLRDVKGRHNTEIAFERLVGMLPEQHAKP